MFESDPTVLYFSVHRYDRGTFYPGGPYADFTSVGSGEGEGFSVNVPWPTGMMGDAEYIRAFEQVFMPIARQFNPDLVFISAGYDAARGDPLGGCDITPDGYARMTKMLMELADGRIVLALEGGYNLDSITQSFAACTHTLLGHELPPRDPEPCRHDAQRVIGRVRHHLIRYWQSLLPPAISLCQEQLPTAVPEDEPLDLSVQHVFVYGYWEVQLRGHADIEWMKPLYEGLTYEPATVSQAVLQMADSQPRGVLLASAATHKSRQLQGYLLSCPNSAQDPEEFYRRLSMIEEVQGFPQSCQRLVVVVESTETHKKTLAYLHYHQFAATHDPNLDKLSIPSGSWVSHMSSIQLLTATRSVDLHGMRTALANGADPDFTDNTGAPPLVLVVSQVWGMRSLQSLDAMRLEAVELLLQHGAKPGNPSGTGLTSLHIASSRGQLDVVERLLAAGAPPQCRSEDNITPLWLAALNGHTSVVEALAAAGANVNAAASNGSTAAHAAAMQGRLNTLIMLRKLGAAMDVAGPRGSTPIHMAIAKGHPVVVAALVKMGASTTNLPPASALATLKGKIDAEKVAAELCDWLLIVWADARGHASAG